ncbi:MAG: hypothetical protein J6W09_02120 [Bacteroidales bacterium]|nr:hypothetical protein [Bacteroidales bacterium]
MILADFMDEMAVFPVSSMILADFMDEMAVFPVSSMILAENVDEMMVLPNSSMIWAENVDEWCFYYHVAIFLYIFAALWAWITHTWIWLRCSRP